MNLSVAEKIVLAVCLATLLGILVTALLVVRMNDVVNQRPDLSGQWVEIDGTRTERRANESMDSWRARIMESLRTVDEVRDASENH